MEQEKKQENLKKYLQEVSPIMEQLIKQLIRDKPDGNQIVAFIKEWCIENQSKLEEGSESEEEQDEEEVCELLSLEEIQKKKQQQKLSVSAEAYGQFNQRGIFIPKVIAKTEEQKEVIKQRVGKAFMFSGLDQRELEIVIDAFSEKQVEAGEKVIEQGEDGDVLYLVSEGTLDCTKIFSDGEKWLKEYGPGDTFGELALLYNAPRAATIKAKTNATLFALDRETFNNIVKDAAQKKRQGFENTLSKIEILQEMDDYERNQLADALQRKTFNEGEQIVTEGEQGDTFYFLEEGKAIATKSKEVVYHYSAGDYFGELALLRNQPRAASIIAETNLTVCMLDRDSFRRLLGPLEELLKRNFSKYTKFVI